MAGRISLRLGDVCTKIGSGATPRGGRDSYKGGSTALIRSQNVYNDGFHHDGLVYIDQKQAADLDAVEVHADDVLLNITGDSVARCALVDPSALPARVNQHVMILRPRNEKLDPRFLRYALISPATQAHLLAMASAGATRNALTKAMIENLEIEAPSIDEQRAIAHVLGTLDDRIELNRRTNETLEAMARALFKSWLVDFDPVRAKAAGSQPAGMDVATAALFPSEFVESELGPVPKGWKALPLDRIADFKNGLALQKYRPKPGEPRLPVVKIADLRTGVPNREEWAREDIDPACVLDDGDVVFSWSGSLTVVVWCGGRAALNQHLFRVTSSESPKSFYLGWLQHHLPGFQQIAADKATTMGHIQRHHLTAAWCAVPPPTLLAKFGDTADTLLSKRVHLDQMSHCLARTREALLPRLLSGELRIPDAERIAASVGASKT